MLPMSVNKVLPMFMIEPPQRAQSTQRGKLSSHTTNALLEDFHVKINQKAYFAIGQF